MKLCRTDIETNKRKLRVPNSSWSGFSSGTLRYGHFFLYKDTFGQRQLAKCHGQVRPIAGGPWRILAQVINATMSHSFERWVDPSVVTETIPPERMPAQIIELFIEQENLVNK